LFSVFAQGVPLFPFLTFFVGVTEPWGILGGIPTFKALDLAHGFGVDPFFFIVVDEVPSEGILASPHALRAQKMSLLIWGTPTFW
jgi:hypothetical protein